MIRTLFQQIYDNNKRYVELACTPDDPLPTEGIITGSVATEVDAEHDQINAYIFDEVSGEWVKGG